MTVDGEFRRHSEVHAGHERHVSEDDVVDAILRSLDVAAGPLTPQQSDRQALLLMEILMDQSDDLDQPPRWYE